MFTDLIKCLFPNIKPNNLIKAYKYGNYAKVDIVLEVNGIKKGISIKSGNKNSVHIEKIDTFIKKLEELKFNLSKELLGYLYSDGSINNTGINRISSLEYKENHENEISIIN